MKTEKLYFLEQFRENIKQFVNSLNQYSTQYKFAKKYGLVKEIKIESFALRLGLM